MTKNQCLLELYVLELELFLRTERFENMDVVYCKAISMEDRVLGSQHVSAAHGKIFSRTRGSIVIAVLTWE